MAIIYEEEKKKIKKGKKIKKIASVSMAEQGLSQWEKTLHM